VSGLRLAVIGVGHMGRLHVQKVSALAARDSSVVLLGVADADAERSTEVAAEAGVRGVTDFRDLLPEIDAAIVAVPTVDHYEVVSATLSAGVDVLVEKPIAATIAEAEKLLSIARDGGRLLQVGHLEWFNAAMREVAASIRRPRFVESHRLGPFVGRATDVDVVRDLMIHDLDVIQRLVGEEPVRIEAIGIPVITDRVDIANARIGFPGGCVANLTASRVSATPMRRIRFFQRDGYFSIDFLEQAVAIARRLESGPNGTPEIERQRLDIEPGDALLSQLESFVEAVRTREVRAGAAHQGLSALRTALRVVEAMPPLDELQ
jgi:predicted dehydrogenase